MSLLGKTLHHVQVGPQHFYSVPQPLATAAPLPVLVSLSCCPHRFPKPFEDILSLLTHREVPSMLRNSTVNIPRGGFFPRPKASHLTGHRFLRHSPQWPVVPLPALGTMAPALSSLSHTLGAIHSWAMSCVSLRAKEEDHILAIL